MCHVSTRDRRVFANALRFVFFNGSYFIRAVTDKKILVSNPKNINKLTASSINTRRTCPDINFNPNFHPPVHTVTFLQSFFFQKFQAERHQWILRRENIDCVSNLILDFGESIEISRTWRRNDLPQLRPSSCSLNTSGYRPNLRPNLTDDDPFLTCTVTYGERVWDSPPNRVPVDRKRGILYRSWKEKSEFRRAFYSYKSFERVTFDDVFTRRTRGRLASTPLLSRRTPRTRKTRPPTARRRAATISARISTFSEICRCACAARPTSPRPVRNSTTALTPRIYFTRLLFYEKSTVPK